MKITFTRLAVILFAASVLSGCQSPKATSPPATAATAEARTKARDAAGPARAIRNNCYSLLHQLLDQQKHVGLLRFIKREESDVKQLVKRIAANAAAGSDLLEEFAKQDPSISLDDTWLPPGEAATREAIAATRKQELLHQSGDEFELSLLLTQIQALSYASHLAKIAGENDTQPERARALAGLSQDMDKLYHEVFALLRLRRQ